VPRETERSQGARSEVCFGALPISDAALGDGREDERLTRTQRDIAVPEVEVAVKGNLDPFADPERAVLLDVDGHVRREEREAIGARDAGQRKGSNRGGGRER
jgi:hypothetical protein